MESGDLPLATPQKSMITDPLSPAGENSVPVQIPPPSAAKDSSPSLESAVYDACKKYFVPETESIRVLDLPQISEELATMHQRADFSRLTETAKAKAKDDVLAFSEFFPCFLDWLRRSIDSPSPPSPGGNDHDHDNEPGTPHEEGKQPEQNGNEQAQREEDPLSRQLRESIKQYDSILRMQKQRGEDIKGTLQIIGLMKKQLESYNIVSGSIRQKRSQILDSSSDLIKSPLHLSEANSRGLHEIFEFYCKQQRMIGGKPTFDDLSTALSHMTLGEFCKFCKDFVLPVSAEKAKALFARRAGPSRLLGWELFQTVLQDLAGFVADVRGEEMQRSEAGREICEKKVGLDEEKMEELLRLLHCSEPSKYRKRLSGMALPFGVRDKLGRIRPDDPCMNYKYRPQKSPSEVRDAVERINLQRLAEKRRKASAEYEKYQRNRAVLERIRKKQLASRVPSGGDSGMRKVEVSSVPKSPPKKLTLQILKNLNYRDINPGGGGTDWLGEAAAAEDDDSWISTQNPRVPVGQQRVNRSLILPEGRYDNHQAVKSVDRTVVAKGSVLPFPNSPNVEYGCIQNLGKASSTRAAKPELAE